MNSRERVQASMAHREPDRVPIDFGGHRSSGISAIAYRNLKKALGISAGDIYVYDIIQQLAIVEEEVLDAVGTDVIELGRAFLLDDEDWKEWILPDGTPCKIPAYINIKQKGGDWHLLGQDGAELGIQKEGCLYFEQTHWPWLDRDITAQDFSDLDKAFASNMWTGISAPGGHIPLTDDGLLHLEKKARTLRESTDRAIIGLFGGNLFEVPQFFYRNDTYFMHMGLEPESCKRLSEALCAYYLPRMEKWLGAVGPYIDVMLFGDDLGGQNGPLLSPQMYKDLYKPWHSIIWRKAKELAPHIGIHLHSCGGIEPLLDDMIDAGLEMANPVQFTCRGMDPLTLKGRYGDRFTFWGGGCDTREILPNGTPEQIADHVRELIDIWRKDGGFVFQQVHNIMADIPPENIIAMFEAARGN